MIKAKAGMPFVYEPGKEPKPISPQTIEDKLNALGYKDKYGRRVLSPTLAHVRIANPRHVAKLMAKTISQMRSGVLDPRIGSAIARCARIALDAVRSDGKKEEIRKVRGQDYMIRRIVEVEAMPAASPEAKKENAKAKA